MAIISQNSSTFPMTLRGLAVQNGNFNINPNFSLSYGRYINKPSPVHEVISLTTLNQVVGLVPLYPCVADECRLGKYGGNDSQFMLPVFAEDQTSVSGDYKNDFSSFLFDLPAASGLSDYVYYLDRRIGNSWTQEAILDDNTYGIYSPIGSICNKNYYTGYQIQWNKVLAELGEGIYRFRVESSTGTNTDSVNHIQFTDFKIGDISWISLTTIGFGDICPPFYLDTLDTLDNNMIAFANFINLYQDTTLAYPLFRAVWNSGTEQIDLLGLFGQNCPVSADYSNLTIDNLAASFSGGERTFVSYGCYATPPYCLKTWNCYSVDRTTRFDSFYTGGVIGNVNKAKPGTTWSFCCSGKPVVYPTAKSLLKIRFWNQSVVDINFTITFNMDYGYDLVNPITILAGSTYIQMAQKLVTDINAHQATLSPAQFSAYYNPVNQSAEITNLFGENITFTMLTSGVTSTNTEQWTFYPPGYYGNISGDNHVTTGQFIGGTNINATSNLNIPTAISWKDSIRVFGEFGYEKTDYERKSIKYATGVVNKIRDEAILKHTWKSANMPFWFHERFKVYGLMADKLLVSDYNLNNSDYNIKLYSVQGDSSYDPEYKGFPRETQVRAEFKPAIQNIKRTRCC